MEAFLDTFYFHTVQVYIDALILSNMAGIYYFVSIICGSYEDSEETEWRVMF